MKWTPLIGTCVCVGMLWGCTTTNSRHHIDSAHHAHDAYVEAINSNNLENFLSMVTDDIVFMAPNAPIMQEG
jgi:ketosteroid isomerase-like protein